MNSDRRWTGRLLIAFAGVAVMCTTIRAEEKQNNLLTSLSSTTISGYVDSSATWNIGSGNSIPEPATGALLLAGAAFVILFQATRRRNPFSRAASKNLDQ